MTLKELKDEFSKLGDNYKTKDIDRLCKKLIKQKQDVSFLKDMILENQQYHRLYFQVSLAQISGIEKKMEFIEDNFLSLKDWWHVDQLMTILGNELDFDFAYEKAKEYVKSDLEFVRRFGYVMFIPRLVKNEENIKKLMKLLKNDDEYYVVMGQAWLISYFGMYAPKLTYEYLKNCDLKYNITGKAVQKICDSYVVSKEDKERFRGLRTELKGK